MQTELNFLDIRYAQIRQQMRCLESCPDIDVPDNFQDLLDSLEDLFAFESQLMESHNFPGLRCHVEQHARVLGALHRTHSLVMNGSNHPARHAGNYLLKHWLELHNETLDACLAVWLDCAKSKRTISSMSHEPVTRQVMRDLNRRAKALWVSHKSDESNSSRQNRQGSGE